MIQSVSQSTSIERVLVEFMRNNGKWTAIIVVIGLLIAVGCFEINKVKKERVIRDQLQEMSDELIVMESERTDCKIKLSKINEVYAKELDGKAVISFLITDISENFVLDDIYPIFSKDETKALLAVTEDVYPGMDGCIAIDKTYELMNEGWDLCYLIDDNTTVDEWKNDMDTLSYNFDLSDSINSAYIPLELYQQDEKLWNEQFVEYGIDYLAIGNANTTYKTDHTINSKPWKISASNWLDPKVFAFMKKNTQELNTFLFLIGGRNDSIKGRKFSDDDFEGMISSYRSYKDADALVNMNLKDAYEYRRSLVDSRNAGRILIDSETQEKKDKLEQRLEELEPMIAEREKKVTEFLGKVR